MRLDHLLSKEQEATSSCPIWIVSVCETPELTDGILTCESENLNSLVLRFTAWKSCDGGMILGTLLGPEGAKANSGRTARMDISSLLARSKDRYLAELLLTQ